MDAKLVVVGGDAVTKEVNLKLPVVIGRGRDVSLTLPHPLVSRRHCEIIESNGQLVVRDMGSLNGTFINNERITEAVLPPGELLTIGTVTFRAVYDAEAVAEAKPVLPPGGNGAEIVMDPMAPVKGISDSTETVPVPEAVPVKESDTDELEVDDFEPIDEGEEGEVEDDATTMAPHVQAGSNASSTTPPSQKPKDVDEELADFLSSLD